MERKIEWKTNAAGKVNAEHTQLQLQWKRDRILRNKTRNFHYRPDYDRALCFQLFTNRNLLLFN